MKNPPNKTSPKNSSPKSDSPASIPVSGDPLATGELNTVEQIFKQMDQPIWIVTSACPQRGAGGLTATWVHQASVDREFPTVLIGLAPNHFTCELLRESKRCVLHLLRPDQHEIAWHFAQPSSRDFNKLERFDTQSLKLTLSTDETIELPFLSDCHSCLICRSLKCFDAGDRIYFLCQVIQVVESNPGEFLRESSFFGRCTDDQVKKLKADLLHDVGIQRPLLSSWLEKEADLPNLQ